MIYRPESDPKPKPPDENFDVDGPEKGGGDIQTK